MTTLAAFCPSFGLEENREFTSLPDATIALTDFELTELFPFGLVYECIAAVAAPEK